MEVTTPLTNLPYKEQVKKKQLEVVFLDPRIRSMRIPKPWFLFTVLLFWSLAGEQVMEVTTPLDPDQLVRGTDPASDPDPH